VRAARDLSALFAPRGVALVGASADPMAWGGWLVTSLLAESARFELHLVNRRGGEIAGRPVYTSLAEVPDGVDLAILAIPAAATVAAVEDGLGRGVRAFVAIAAGFGEQGEEGLRIERALAARVREAGGVLVGPNCLGIYEPAHGLNALGQEAQPGCVAFAAQSGNMATEVGNLLARHGHGFSRLASLGNASDLTVAEVLASSADHEPTRVAACYLEDASEGRALVEAVRAVAERKPVVVMAAGRSQVGAAAAASHTGALAGQWRVLSAALRDAGARLVRSPGELADAVAALAATPPLAGRRVGVMTDGGGNGAIAADLLADVGLDLPPLEAATVERLRPEIPSGSVANPVDLAGAGERDVESFGRIAEGLLADGGIDAVLMTGYFGGYAQSDPVTGELEAVVGRRLAAAAATVGKPFVVHTMHDAGLPGIAALREHGVPVYGRLDAAVTALGHLPRPELAPLREARPAPAMALPDVPTYDDARALAAACGVPLSPGALAATPEEAAAVAAEFGGQVVLKLVSPSLLHKTDAGGVVLDVAPAQAASQAARLLALDADATGVFVERQAPPGIDLIVGARRDPCFGPVVLVGLGGILAELLDDVAVALAPAAPEHVARLLRGLRGAALLEGVRGQSSVDADAIVQVAVALGDLLCGRPDLAEVEINPLRAWPDGVLALDARAVRTTPLDRIDDSTLTAHLR
jgi:acyl-CoA synthetase (NDP forming)